jgi:hypothetical protein
MTRWWEQCRRCLMNRSMATPRDAVRWRRSGADQANVWSRARVFGLPMRSATFNSGQPKTMRGSSASVWTPRAGRSLPGPRWRRPVMPTQRRGRVHDHSASLPGRRGRRRNGHKPLAKKYRFGAGSVHDLWQRLRAAYREPSRYEPVEPPKKDPAVMRLFH